MKSSMKKVVTTGAVVAALALGGTGVAFATTGSASAPASTTSSTSDTPDQEQTYVGTIPAPAEASDGDGETNDDATEASDGDGETNDDATEARGTETNDDAAEGAESAALEKLATVTPDEATAVALNAVPGAAGEVELENENGYVVYGIEITATDGTVTDVKVDAGDASVLAQEADDAEGRNED